MITADTLTTAQAEKLKSRIDPMTRYVCRLHERLDAAGCPGADPFRVAVERASDAMRALSTELHFCACKAGVGPARERLAHVTITPPPLESDAGRC